jgi:sugar phosphate isomerase/epimerase
MMPMKVPLSVSIAGLEARKGRPWCSPEGVVDPRKAIEWVASVAPENNARWIQLDATLAGIRPRELDRSARRDLAALLRRSGLGLSGLDLFIPGKHFEDAVTLERALGAVAAACELVDELSRLVDAQRVVSVVLPRTAKREKIAKSIKANSGSAPDRGPDSESHAPSGEDEWTRAIGASITSGVRLADHANAESPRIDGVLAGVDPATALLAGLDIMKVVGAAGDRIAAARLSDANELGRVVVGTGNLDVLAYLVSLHAARYTSPVVLDLRSLKDQEAAFDGLRAERERGIRMFE